MEDKEIVMEPKIEYECDHTWIFLELTELWRKWKCEKCGEIKLKFRNLYPGYQDGD